MPAKRDSLEPRPVLWLRKDAAIGGLGLDWHQVPPDVAVAEDAAAEWERLGEVYASVPVRFREGDRQAVAMYCMAYAVCRRASAELLIDGVVVDGRSSVDAGRKVKSPAMAVWTQASAQLRYWARELGLTPDARVRQGIKEADEHSEDADEASPFGWAP